MFCVIILRNNYLDTIICDNKAAGETGLAMAYPVPMGQSVEPDSLTKPQSKIIAVVEDRAQRIAEEPALLLGVDILRKFHQDAIDFKNGKSISSCRKISVKTKKSPVALGSDHRPIRH